MKWLFVVCLLELLLLLMFYCCCCSLSFQKCGWLTACEAIFVYISRNSRSLLTEFRRAAVLLFVFLHTHAHGPLLAVALTHSLIAFALSLYSLSIAIHFVSSLLVIRFIALFLLAHRAGSSKTKKRKGEEKKEY